MSPKAPYVKDLFLEWCSYDMIVTFKRWAQIYHNHKKLMNKSLRGYEENLLIIFLSKMNLPSESLCLFYYNLY